MKKVSGLGRGPWWKLTERWSIESYTNVGIRWQISIFHGFWALIILFELGSHDHTNVKYIKCQKLYKELGSEGRFNSRGPCEEHGLWYAWEQLWSSPHHKNTEETMEIRVEGGRPGSERCWKEQRTRRIGEASATSEMLWQSQKQGLVNGYLPLVV